MLLNVSLPLDYGVVRTCFPHLYYFLRRNHFHLFQCLESFYCSLFTTHSELHHFICTFFGTFRFTPAHSTWRNVFNTCNYKIDSNPKYFSLSSCKQISNTFSCIIISYTAHEITELYHFKIFRDFIQFAPFIPMISAVRTFCFVTKTSTHAV